MPINEINKTSVQLKLNTIDELFAPPEADPFKPNSRYVAGIDELVQQMIRFHLRGNLTEVVITLPAQAIEPDLTEKVRLALGRCADAQIEAAAIELEQLRRRGRFSLISAIVIIIIAMALVWVIGWLNIFGDVIQSFLVGGLSVFAWVAVWEPFGIYLYEWRSPARNRRIFEKLRQAEVVIRSGEKL